MSGKQVYATSCGSLLSLGGVGGRATCEVAQSDEIQWSRRTPSDTFTTRAVESATENMQSGHDTTGNRCRGAKAGCEAGAA